MNPGCPKDGWSGEAAVIVFKAAARTGRGRGYYLQRWVRARARAVCKIHRNTANQKQGVTSNWSQTDHETSCRKYCLLDQQYSNASFSSSSSGSKQE
ncbi:hypothetical protein NQZ68_022662 [Dissostichus eleginoides]|nr:hypothetical protein NQZ68_022662 [Dissostichus eleginoides]